MTGAAFLDQELDEGNGLHGRPDERRMAIVAGGAECCQLMRERPLTPTLSPGRARGEGAKARAIEDLPQSAPSPLASPGERVGVRGPRVLAGPFPTDNTLAAAPLHD